MDSYKAPILILLLCAMIAVGDVQSAFGQGGSHIWSKSFGGTNSDIGNGVAVDSSGNVVVTGYFFSETADLGGGLLTSAGDYDIFVAKFTSAGTHLWSKRFGGKGDDRGFAVALDNSGNVVVTGIFSGTVDFGGGPLTSAGQSDIFVAKFSGANGSHLWSKSFGNNDGDQGLGVAVDTSGNVVVTGWFTSTVDFGGGALTSAGGYDIFVAKFASGGSHLWSKSFGGPGYDAGNGVAVDSNGNVVVTGVFLGAADFGGGLVTSAAGSYDIFVAKFTSGGSHVWSKRFGAEYNDRGQGVAVDSSDNVVVTGSFSHTVDFGGGPLTSAGTDDMFVAKFTGADGSHLWSKRFDSSGYGVAAGSSGNVVVTGTFPNTVDFGGGPLTSAGSYDIFVAELSGTDGAYHWSKGFGGTGFDMGCCVAVDSSGNVVATGQFMNTLDFGGGPLTSAGTYDIFVLKLESTTGGIGISLSPTALTFPDQKLNTSSAAQTVTLTNSGASAITIASIVATGDFAQTNNCPLTPATLGSGNSCTIDVWFSPTTAGPLVGEITIASDAPGSAPTVPLAGTGMSARVLFSHSSLDFGHQLPASLGSPSIVTLTNSGNLPLQLSDATVSGEYLMSSTCGSILEVDATCSFSVRFFPSGMGPRNGELTIWTNAPGSPHSVSLSGTGADLVMNLIRPSRPIRQNGSSSANLVQVSIASSRKADIAVSCSGAPSGADCRVQPTVVRSGARAQIVTVGLSANSDDESETSSALTPGMTYPVLVTASIGDVAYLVSVPVKLEPLPDKKARPRSAATELKSRQNRDPLPPRRSLDKH